MFLPELFFYYEMTSYIFFFIFQTKTKYFILDWFFLFGFGFVFFFFIQSFSFIYLFMWLPETGKESLGLGSYSAEKHYSDHDLEYQDCIPSCRGIFAVSLQNSTQKTCVRQQLKEMTLFLGRKLPTLSHEMNKGKCYYCKSLVMFSEDQFP